MFGQSTFLLKNGSRNTLSVWFKIHGAIFLDAEACSNFGARCRAQVLSDEGTPDLLHCPYDTPNLWRLPYK
jgi:hypothetical protein